MEMNLGGRIRAAREALGLTQADLARLIGVTQTDAWRYENDVRFPKMSRLFAISDELEITLDWLLRGRRPARERAPRKARKAG